MTINGSHYRLRSSAFERSDGDRKYEPKKVLFLSVEGDETERNYFEHLRSCMEESASDPIIHIEVLRHKRGDGYSSPEHVIELLNEYISLRQGELIPEQLPEAFTKEYSKMTIKQFLENPESFDDQGIKKINDELLKLNIDLEYRRYLMKFDEDGDRFAVILDRDCGSHSRELMEECIRLCREKGYEIYISNPCFEFWLLLHLCDVKNEFADELNEILENRRISNKHTYISSQVSERAHHAKSINLKTFQNIYFKQIPQAIKRSKEFSTNLNELLDELGSNLAELFKGVI